MQLGVFQTLAIISLHAPPMAFSSPLRKHSTLSRRADASTCDFYGDSGSSSGGISNLYLINLGNDEASTECANSISNHIEEQCQVNIEDFSCMHVYENNHETQISFRIDKSVGSQPDCVDEALRLADMKAQDEQPIQCYCLAECWPPETPDF